MRTILFTEEGFEKVKKEFVELKNKRVEAVAELKRAREMGDLSENAAYKVARMQVNQIDLRLRRLTLFLRIGKVVERPFTGAVDINTKVTISDGQKEIRYAIVGDQEANPHEGKISPASPLGKALMGKREGEKVNVITPSGKMIYIIKDIQPTG